MRRRRAKSSPFPDFPFHRQNRSRLWILSAYSDENCAVTSENIPSSHATIIERDVKIKGNIRKKSMSGPVTLEELQQMHQMASVLVIADRAYLPIFQRIEQELAVLQADEDTISRARAVAALYSAAA